MITAPIRTLKFYGQGYSSQPLSVVASVNDVTVFSGEIPTVNESFDSAADANAVLFSFDTGVDSSFDGSLPMSILVSGTDGGVVFGNVEVNQQWVVNPAFTEEQITTFLDKSVDRATKVTLRSTVASPAFSADEISWLNTANCAGDETANQQYKHKLVSHGCHTYVQSADAYAAVDSIANVAINNTVLTSSTNPKVPADECLTLRVNLTCLGIPAFDLPL
jgi:hypothetical protein